MIGIYAIRNTQNGKMYIGESIDIEKRWKNHQEDLDNGNHHSYKLQAGKELLFAQVFCR